MAETPHTKLPKWVIRRLHQINLIEDYFQRYDELLQMIGEVE